MTATWATSTVGQQFDVQLGKMLDAAKNVGIPKPYVGNRAVQWGRVDVSAGGVVPMSRSDLQRYRLRDGDLLVCEGGEVGRGAIWRNELPECYYQKALHRLRPKNGYDVRLMLALLAYWSATGAFADFVTQTSIAHLPREKFVQMPLPLPSEPEQRRIGEVLQDVDDLIGTLGRLITKKQTIMQGMMQQLLTCRTRLPGFTHPWRTSTWGELSTTIASGATPRRSDPRNWGGSIPWVTSTELKRGKIRQIPQRITEAGRKSASLRIWPSGTFLMAITGLEAAGTRGNCGLLMADAATNQSCMAVIPGPELLTPYLFYYYLHYGESLAFNYTQGTKQMSYTASIVRSLPIELPSDVGEQAAIADMLSCADAELEVLQVRRAKAQNIKAGMMQQLLTGRTRLPLEAAG
ncbi:restriction endonuclease subunit S [Blastococcus sp. SYSU DS0539]